MKKNSLFKCFTVLLACFVVLNSAVDIHAFTVNGYEQDTEALNGIIDQGEAYWTGEDESFSDSMQEGDESLRELPDVSLSEQEEISGADSEPVITDESTAGPTDSCADTSSCTDESLDDLTTAEEALQNIKLKSGLYYISTCESSPKMMCVKYNSKNNAANIQLGTYVSSNVRLFEISETGDGYYYIRNLNSDKYLTETNNNVDQREADSDDDQKWIISSETNGSYHILTKDGKRYLTTASETVGANIYTDDINKGLQNWSVTNAKKLVAGGGISYTYSPEVSADDDHSIQTLSVKIILFGTTLKQDVDYTLDVSSDGGIGILKITGIGEYTGHKTLTFKVADYLLDEGLYFIKKEGNKESVFAVSGNSKSDNAKIIMGPYACSNVRSFRFKKAGSGYYYIQNLFTGKYLTADKAVENAALIQKTLNKSDSQKWRLEKKDGLFCICLKNSDLYLTAAGSAKGTQVGLKSKGTGIQSWEIPSSKIFICGAMTKCTCDQTVSFNTSEAEFNEPAVKVYINNSAIKEGTDYTLSFCTDIANGKGTVTVQGTGAYTGKVVLIYTLKAETKTFSSSADSGKLLSGKTFILHPASDSGLCVRGKGSYIKNGTVLYSGENIYSVMSVFKFVAYANDFKILGGNINYSVYAGSGGRNSATMQKQNDRDYQRWNLIRYDDGKWSVVNKVSGYALTLKDGQIILLPYCKHESQKFIFEEVTGLEASGTLPEVRMGVETYVADAQYVWNFTLESTDTVLYLTKEKYHNTVRGSSGIKCDMKNGTLSVLKAFNLFDRDNISILASVEFGDIIPQAGECYTLILKQEETAKITAILKEVSTGKKVSISRDYGGGFCWGKLNYYVDGSISGHKLRAYSLQSSDCDLVIVGDSYTEGGSLLYRYRQRYSTLIRNALNSETAIVAKGGATSSDGLTWLKQYIADVYHPKYMILEFGMNDKNYDTWLENMQEMIDILKQNDITPILATVPPCEGHSASLLSAHRKMSAWVLKSGYHYLDFEYEMTKNNDRVTPNPATTLTDGVHPTEKIHKTIADAFLKKNLLS